MRLFEPLCDCIGAYLLQGPIERPSSDAEPLSKPYDLTGFGDIHGPKPIRILKPVAVFGLMIDFAVVAHQLFGSGLSAAPAEAPESSRLAL